MATEGDGEFVRRGRTGDHKLREFQGGDSLPDYIEQLDPEFEVVVPGEVYSHLAKVPKMTPLACWSLHLPG